MHETGHRYSVKKTVFRTICPHPRTFILPFQWPSLTKKRALLAKRPLSGSRKAATGERSHLPALHLTDKIQLVPNRGIRFHAAEHGMQGGGVVIRPCEGDQAIVLGVQLAHIVDEITIGRIVDLHGLHVAGEQADMVDVSRLSEGVSLHDERPLSRHEGQHIGLLHALDLGMLQKPRLIQSVDQKIRSAVGAFHTEKHGYPQILPDLNALFVIQEVEFDPFLIGLRAIAVDIAINKMVGNEHARIAKLFIICKGRSHIRRRTSAHGGRVEMSFVKIGLHGDTAFRVVKISIAQKRRSVKGNKKHFLRSAFCFETC